MSDTEHGGTLSTSTTSLRSFIIWTTVLSWVRIARSETLPYTPTTILLSQCASPQCRDEGGYAAYIFSPNGSSVDLLSVNISSTLSATSLEPETLSPALPFLGGNSTSTFTASITGNGTIVAVAGDCSSPGSASAWRYDTASSLAQWSRHETSVKDSANGPSLLGGSLSYSYAVSPALSLPVTYVYGGMCPWTNATASTWQPAASYTNRMLKVSAQGFGPDAAYSAEDISLSEGPIAEAGLTLTPLTPSISNQSGVITQQINYVVLGGHTQAAFVNMSTAALWSLPEESWSFISINPPEAGPSTDLAAKDVATTVDSRSGHSAVLNEDGSALVVLGGWVGDVTEAAMPQLAVLELGRSFDDWQWSVPATQPPGTGIYGHGAALLPGNVMMVYGGYSIDPTSTSSTFKRRNANDDNSYPMFLNLTSMTWTTDYTNPAGSAAAAAGSSAPADHRSSQDKRLGLGLGLGLGLALVLGALAAGLVRLRRVRRRRARRDEVVRSLSQDAARFLGAGPEELHGGMLEHPGLFPWGAQTAPRPTAYEALRGAAQPACQPAPDATAAAAGGTRIPPIYEADEDEAAQPQPQPQPQQKVDDDPFATPPDGGQHREVRDWVRLAGEARTTESGESEAARSAPDGRRTPDGTAASASGSSSAVTYATAPSLAGLRDEGPGLLAVLRGDAGAEEGEDDDDDVGDDGEPGSPSKNRPRRSWFGSLRRVFGGPAGGGGRGGTDDDDSSGSPTRESLMGGGSDYEPRLVGMGPGGRLLRRKRQGGRGAWEDGAGEGGEDEDEWDIERAVEQRLVQVMFTVPRERLRVVNAEIEREEEVLVVDPGLEEGFGAEESAAVEHGDGAAAGQHLGLSGDDRPVSHCSTASAHTAEMVRLERPRTRVLQMVESIESMGRKSSPED